ncbi:hypothetical protein GCM10009576_096930 [Streptomyces rhizosphaericus]|uniref:Uncharacterized protein n=1 Tax=Streptomyces rhizosphaericus TaxID=114699 RepID=A0ABN1STD2_9ACTN
MPADGVDDGGLVDIGVGVDPADHFDGLWHGGRLTCTDEVSSKGSVPHQEQSLVRHTGIFRPPIGDQTCFLERR